jgi:hypothetical protein
VQKRRTLIALVANEIYAEAAAHRGAAAVIVESMQFLAIGAGTDHTKIESMVRYLGIEVDDALAIAEQVDV